MAGKKKGKKGKQVAEPSGSQQGHAGDQSQQQTPQPQQQSRGAQGPQQQGQQQFPGPQHQQPQQDSPIQVPQGPQQQQRPQGQQQPWSAQSRQSQGPPGFDQPQQGFSRQQGQPPRGSQGPQQQQGPSRQQEGHQGQQPWGAQVHQQQQGPQGQPQQAPPGQQQQDIQRGQQSQRGRGRGRAQQGIQKGFPQSHNVGQPQEQPHQPSQRGQLQQRGRGGGRPQQVVQSLPSSSSQQFDQPQLSSQPSTSGSRTAVTEGEIKEKMFQMQISKVEGGQGDSMMEPMESKIPIKPGTKGRKIIVETNHLPLNLGKLTSAIHYDVNLNPDLPRSLLRAVLEAFREKHYKDRYPAFDGRKNLYSTSMLPFGDFIADEIVVQDMEGKGKKFKVEIKFANKVDLTPLRDLMKSTETPREAMQVIDIVLRSAPAKTCISYGRSFFVKPQAIIDLGEGMEMYNGFYQSAIRGWKPFLNVDVAHKSFPKNTNVLDVLPELFDSYYQPFRREDLTRPLGRNHQDILNNFIKTLKVSYEIPNAPATRRVFRVNGIDIPPRDKMFKMDNKEQISIEKYFERNKNYRLRYPHLPTLWVGARQRENKILLPLELCTLEEGQVIKKKMTETQTSKMIKQAATSTTVRKDKIITALRQAGHNNDPTVREFGFSIGNEFEKLQARVLQPPSLGYANQTRVNPNRGVWRSEKFFQGVTINKWTIACVDRRAPRPDDLSNLAQQIYRNAGSCGMNMTAEAERPFDHIGGSQNIHDIRKYFQTKKEKQYDVIFIIVPNNGPQYSYVKTAAEINVGCLTQCIKTRTLSKMNQQTAINILLKVNSKLNGTNHFLLTRPPIMSRPCMIMGADVTHPSPDATEIPSVAAVTASHDPKAFQYNICWRLQPPKIEIIEDLEAITIEQLKYFYQKTKVKPERIIFFRDAVSEGQFAQVRYAEIRAIRAACKKLQADGYEPAITFLVVQKRHHTRLFPTNPKDSEDRNMNVPAGTCVDTTITHPFMQDFYLVSHASIQGVAKPTKYCTLWDDNNLTNDDIEELTYYLCHMFTRCNRSVSYPAPTYYAHLAAARAKVYIENDRLNMDELHKEMNRYQIQDVIRKGLPMFFV